MEDLVLQVPDYKCVYKVQLSPTMPKDGKHAIVAQAGPHGAIWVRVRDASRLPLDLFDHLLVEGAAQKCGAVYVGIPQQQVAKFPQFMNSVLAKGYQFFNYNKDLDEMVWYKWFREGRSDIVPPYATSIEGGGALILSPDSKQVLLVKEYGKYGRCGGAVDRGESCIECAIRESKEETGVLLDASYCPRLALSYNQPRSRDNLINDHFMLFVLKAKSTELKLDMQEVNKAQWVDLQSCVDVLNEWEAKNGGVYTPSYEELSDDLSTSGARGENPQAKPSSLLPKAMPRALPVPGVGEVGCMELLGIKCILENKLKDACLINDGKLNPIQCF